MSEQFFVKQLPNGLTLLGQRMENVSSVAMTLAVPAGAACDPSERTGTASVLAEWCLKGAGDRDTRQLNEQLDALGCQHSESVHSRHISLSAAVLSRNLPEVLGVYADILRRPRLEDATFDVCRDLALQDLAGLEDEPARKCGLLLRERFHPWPLGRSAYGRCEHLEALSPDEARGHAGRFLTPGGTIVAIAGDIDWDAFCQLAERHLGDWQGQEAPSAALESAPGGVVHMEKDSAQTHISLAFAAPTVDDRLYYPCRVAATVLSGGMSSRLFTEVREKRGLAYHVSCRYHSLKGSAGLFAYAGTKPPLAQQTFDVTVSEIRRLAEGVADDEFERAKTQLKSSLVMQGQSTMARADSLVTDWYQIGRLRSLREISEQIGSVTHEQIADFFQAWPVRDFTILIIGPTNVDTAAVTGEN